jgi:hypothetical protein
MVFGVRGGISCVSTLTVARFSSCRANACGLCPGSVGACEGLYYAHVCGCVAPDSQGTSLRVRGVSLLTRPFLAVCLRNVSPVPAAR